MQESSLTFKDIISSDWWNQSFSKQQSCWTIWMNYMDANKTAGEKAWRLLHKNAANNIQQVLETTPHKAAAVRPPTTHHENPSRTRHVGYCWISRDELISYVLLWTPSHGREKARWPTRLYIQQLCEDTGCNPGDLPEAMNDRDGWQERVRDIRADGTTRWYDDVTMLTSQWI